MKETDERELDCLSEGSHFECERIGRWWLQLHCNLEILGSTSYLPSVEMSLPVSLCRLAWADLIEHR